MLLSWFVICFNIISCIVFMLWNYLSYWQLHRVSLEILYFVTCVLYHKTSSCHFCLVYFVSQKTILIVWSVLFYKEPACYFARSFYILRKVSANKKYVCHIVFSKKNMLVVSKKICLLYYQVYFISQVSPCYFVSCILYHNKWACCIV